MSILDKASLVVTPTAYKEDKLYSIIPRDGSGDLTWTRATDATRINKDGYVERVCWNLLSYSEEFDNTSWNKTRSSVSSNIINGPFGTLNGYKLIEDTSISNTHQVTKNYTFTTGMTYTFSAYVKAKERFKGTLYIFGKAGTEATFDLQLQTISKSQSLLGSTIQNVGNDWFRVSITWTYDGVGGAVVIALHNGISGTYTGDGVSGFYIWGAQLVEGSEPKDYFPTTDRLNVPRINYPTTGGTPSILIEPQRTNLIVKSEELNDNTIWFTTNATILSNIITAPNGILNADKLVEDAGVGGVHRFYNQTITTVSGNTYTFTIYAKAGERSVFYIDMRSTNAVGKYMYSYNLTTKAITKIGSDDAVSTKIEDVGNGWYRCSITSVVNDPNAYVVIYMTNGSTNGYVGESGYGMYFWGLQYEQGTNPTSYIPTTNATATRNADVVEKTNISDLIGQTEGTVLFNVDVNSPTTGLGSQSLVVLRPSSGSFMTSYISNSGSLSVDFYPQGSYLFSLNGGSIGLGKNKIAIVYKSGNYKLFKNGTLLTSNNNNTTPNLTLSVLTLANTFNGSRKNITLFKQALTDAECITLTTL